jgi:hypothetical protein
MLPDKPTNLIRFPGPTEGPRSAEPLAALRGSGRVTTGEIIDFWSAREQLERVERAETEALAEFRFAGSPRQDPFSAALIIALYVVVAILLLVALALLVR